MTIASCRCVVSIETEVRTKCLLTRYITTVTYCNLKIWQSGRAKPAPRTINFSSLTVGTMGYIMTWSISSLQKASYDACHYSNKALLWAKLHFKNADNKTLMVPYSFSTFLNKQFFWTIQFLLDYTETSAKFNSLSHYWSGRRLCAKKSLDFRPQPTRFQPQHQSQLKSGDKVWVNR